MQQLSFEQNKFDGRKQKICNMNKSMTETLAGQNRAIRAQIAKISELDDEGTKLIPDARPTDAESLIASYKT